MPVGLIGTDKVMPVGAKIPHVPRSASRAFRRHPSISPRTGRSLGPRAPWRHDEIMAAIHALSEQELANAYNEAPAQNPIERIKQVLPHERL